MKKNNSLILFCLCLLATVGTWSVLFKSLEMPSQLSKLSIKLEKIRSLGIDENPVEIRRAVEIPENIKDDMRDVLESLKKGIEDNSQAYRENEIIEIIKVLSAFGERASFASSTILKLIQQSAISKDVDSVYFQGLLALVRITRSPESAESVIREKCLDHSSSDNGSLYSCVALLRLGLNLPKEVEVETLKFVTELYNEESKTLNLWLEKGGMIVEKVDAVLGPLCLYSAVLKNGQLEEFQRIIVKILQSNLSSHVKVAALNCTIDMATKMPSLLDLISHTMQFASDKTLRKEALLTLLHIGSERSLELAKAYGHKFINGEPQPEIITPHPFREWAIESISKKPPSQ